MPRQRRVIIFSAATALMLGYVFDDAAIDDFQAIFITPRRYALPPLRWRHAAFQCRDMPPCRYAFDAADITTQQVITTLRQQHTEYITSRSI